MSFFTPFSYRQQAAAAGGGAAPDIIQTNLIRNYNLQNLASYPGSGTTWTDLMGSGYNATLNNGPTYTSGTPNYLLFDGSNDQATANDAGMPTGASNRTIGAWIYPITTAQGAFDLIGYGTNPGFNQWVGGAWFTDPNYPPTPNWSINVYGPWIPTSIAGSNMSFSTWQLVQFTYDSSYNWQLMVNGGTGTGQYKSGNYGNIVNTVLGGNFYIGYLPSGFGPVNARYGQYFAYDAALSQSDLQTNYNNTKALYGL
jgi:hypothetical protein